MADGKLVRIGFRSGETIKVAAGDAPDLGALYAQLQQSEFVQLGEDTIVRTGEVAYVRLAGEAKQSEDRSHSRVSSAPRPHRLLETKPFFVTSEFVLAFAAWVALLLTTLATDSIDAPLFTLLTIAILAGYLFSRGFAKANTPSEAWDPREEWSPGR